MEHFKSVLSIIAECTEAETHLSIKFSNKNLGGVLRPKSVRRTLAIGLIYGPRANKQFDIASLLDFARPSMAFRQLNLSPDDCVHNFHV